MRDILFLLVLFSLIPLSFIRPWIGILAWSWIGYMNPHRLGWGAAVHFPAAMLVGLAVLAGILFVREKKSIPWSRELIILLLLAVYFTFTSFFAWAPDPAWEQWDKVMKIMLFTFLTTMLIRGKYRIHALIVVIALSIGFYGFKGGIFTFLTGGAYRIYGPRGSFIADNNSIGLAMIMVLPLLVTLAQIETRKWLKRFFYIVSAFTFISIIFTYSRGAMLGLAVITLVMFWGSKRRWLVALMAIPIGLVGLNFAPEQLTDRASTIETYEEDASAMQRIQAWGVAWNIAKENPFTGGGFSLDHAPDELWLSYAEFMVENAENYARAFHSIYFDMLGHHGFVAFGFFLALLMFTLLTLRRISKVAMNASESAWIAPYAFAVMVGMIGYIVAGAFLSLAYFDLFYAYVALSAILKRELREATEKADEVRLTHESETTAPAS